MSSKAPLVPGGTTPNVGERFHLESVDSEDVNVQVGDAPDAENNDDLAPSINPETGMTEIESLCVECGENGTTRLMLTKIPFFREVVIMSFHCEHCEFRNSEVQFGGVIQEKGCKKELLVTSAEDLNRQLIKSETCSVFIPELDFEIPAKTQRGCINTIEGLLMKAISDLRENQDHRREINPEMTQKLDDVLAKLAMMASGITLPFKIIIDDPAGNSYIENPFVPSNDPNMKMELYYRSEAQDLACGLQPDQSHDVPSEQPHKLPARNAGLDQFVQKGDLGRREAIIIAANCYACGAKGESTMCVTDIPHFKEVIIMAFSCESCGFKTNEIKGGGAIPPKGERITLKVSGKDSSDLDRDILKSDTAGITIPEIELEMEAGSLGGLYTTVEGLLSKIKENITGGNPFAVGDSDGGRSKLAAWIETLDSLKTGIPFTLILEDPLANSFIYSENGDPENDPAMTVEKYVRSDYENDILGLNDMDTETYATNVSKEEIKSDKESMAEGGKAMLPSAYHPNPNAVMQLDKIVEEEEA